eukprot:362622-Chlamydomonas_euryale.AAC.7
MGQITTCRHPRRSVWALLPGAALLPHSENHNRVRRWDLQTLQEHCGPSCGAQGLRIAAWRPCLCCSEHVHAQVECAPYSYPDRWAP